VAIVVDDATLLAVLARQAGQSVQAAADGGEALTTGSWYYRLNRAIHDPASLGHLSRTAAALPAAARAALIAAVDQLPREIVVPGPRLTVPIMGNLQLARRVNHLTGEALAVALLADASIRVATDGPGLGEGCRDLNIALDVRSPFE